MYRSPNIVRVFRFKEIEIGRSCVARMEAGKSAFKSLTGKPTGKRPLGRPRRKWEENIRMDFKGIGIKTRN